MAARGEEKPTASGIGALRGPGLGRNPNVWRGARWGSDPKEREPGAGGMPGAPPHPPAARGAAPHAPASRHIRRRRSQSHSAGGSRALIDTGRGRAPAAAILSLLGQGGAELGLGPVVTGAGKCLLIAREAGFGQYKRGKGGSTRASFAGMLCSSLLPLHLCLRQRLGAFSHSTAGTILNCNYSDLSFS